MRILMYQGAAQYNALNRFSEGLGEGLQKLGHTIEILSPQELQKNHSLLNEALRRQPNLVIGFNGMGADFKATDGRSIYEASGSQYLGLLLDHPAFHQGRLMKAAPHAMAGVVDLSHLEYLKEIWPGHCAFFAPHGGIQCPEHAATERPIDILFLGTGLDPAREKKEWEKFPRTYRHMLQEAYDAFLEKPQAWDKLLLAAASKHRLQLPTHLLGTMIVQLEMIMRAEYRMRVLQAFDKGGLKVTIMGNGWEHAKFRHHELHPSVEFFEGLELMCQAKFALNASPQFFQGSHERVFAAMLNGAIPITTASTYFNEHFIDEEHYLSFELKTLKQAIESLKEIMVSKTRLKEMRQAAKVIALRDHTWEKRAVELMDKVETLALQQIIYYKQNL